MSRPTRPPGPPYPDEPYPDEPYQGQPYPDERYQDEPHGGEPYQEAPYQDPPPPPPPTAQPRFTPRTGPQPGAQSGPQPARPGAPSHPAPQQQPYPQQQSAPQRPYPGPPPGAPFAHGSGPQPAPDFPADAPPTMIRPSGMPPLPPPAVRATQPQAHSGDGPAQPTFTPSGRGGRHGGQPRPSFTPRGGNTRDDRRREVAAPPTAFFSPAPAGYQPVPVPEEYGYAPAATPRFTPVDRQAEQADQDNRTRILERPEVAPPSTGPQRRSDDTSPNLARSSKAMAFGTIASRGTGFLRTFVILAVLGAGQLSGAYNNSNTLPNTVYYLMLGGIFTAVVVPLLVRAAKEDPDRGEAYAERIYTLGVISLLIVTVVATLLSAPLVDLYAGGVSGQPGTHAYAESVAYHHLMVLFAYFFIPQIFFYGMDSLLGAILNTRGRFGANMWTPVINNVVVIIVGGVFYLMAGKNTDPLTVSPTAIHVLAIGTTLGIVIQSICLFPVLRRAGFSMHLRWDLRRYEIREIGHMAGWMFGYVASQALGNLVVQRAANAASNTAVHHGVSTTAYYTIYSNAWQLFQLPYAIVGISVISALLPRMSGHANERRYSLVRDDFSKGVRIASVIVVPAAIFLAVMGSPLCEFLFAHGRVSIDQARLIGQVFGVFSLGLVPFMLTQLQLRVFYSFHQNKTPAIIGIVMLIVGVIGALVAVYVLPYNQTVIGLAVSYDLVSVTGALIAWPLLLRRVGSLDGWRITRSLVRMVLATLPGLAFIFVIIAVVGSFMHQGPLYGFVITLVGGGGALLLYALCSRLLGIEEFRTLMRSVGGRFG